jgi:putative phosphoesterase
VTAVVAVIADTHMPRGSRRVPRECLERLARASTILHAGDIVGASFLAELRAIGPPVVAVHGNMDEPALRDALPESLVVDVGGETVGMVHDAGRREGREERLVQRFGGCAAVVYGHTHMPHVERHRGVWILNPGSPTERRRAAAATMIELELAGGDLRPRLVSLTA